MNMEIKNIGCEFFELKKNNIIRVSLSEKGYEELMKHKTLVHRMDVDGVPSNHYRKPEDIRPSREGFLTPGYLVYLGSIPNNWLVLEDVINLYRTKYGEASVHRDSLIARGFWGQHDEPSRGTTFVGEYSINIAQSKLRSLKKEPLEHETDWGDKVIVMLEKSHRDL